MINTTESTNNSPYKTEFNPREYQLKLVDKCKKRNLIICLATGSGKTYIAIMLIKELQDAIMIPFSEGGKRTIFLVNTVPLVQQQAQVIKNNLAVTVGDYYGDKKINNKVIDSWDKAMWDEEIQKNQVLVMSAQILVELLSHDYINFNRINLLIFDEAHHARNNHPYNQIMKLYKESINSKKTSSIRILGLTASIVNSKCKADRFNASLNELQNNLCCRVETASMKGDTDDGAKYFNKPEMKIKCFEKQFKEDFILLTSLNATRDEFKALEDLFKKRIIGNSNENNEQIGFLIEKNPFKEFKKYFSDLACILEELGYYSFYHYYQDKLKLQIKEILNEIKNHYVDFYMSSSEIITKIFQFIDTICECISPENENKLNDINCIYECSSPKVKLFLDVVKEKHLATKETNQEKFHAIVFVERKETALMLQKLLENISKLDEWKFIKCEYIVGHSNIKTGKRMDCRQQKLILDKFRTSEINILIGTSIIEEGVDIPACNMVLRFNEPKNFGAYIQSKGRARAANSKYYLLVEKDNFYSTFHDEMINFLEIEDLIDNEINNQSLNKKFTTDHDDYNDDGDDEMSCNGIEVDDDDDDDNLDFNEDIIEMGDKLASYKKNNAQITCHYAINLINRYCSNLDKDGVIMLYPKWKMFDLSIDGSPQFRCHLILPPNAIVREEVEGEIMRKKKLAKMSAALKMCKLLDEAGELDDNLIPVSRELWCQKHLEYDVLKEDEEHAKAGYKHKMGTTKTKRDYSKKMSEQFCNNHPTINSDLYLNVFEFENCDSPMNDTQLIQNKFVYGYITKNQIKNVPKFYLKNRTINYHVNFKEVPFNLKLNSTQLALLKQLHEHLFKKIFNFNFECNYETSFYGGYIVFLQKISNFDYEINWNLIEQLISISGITACNFINKNRSSSSSIVNQIARINNVKTGENFIVKIQEVLHDQSPLTPFPNAKYKTYKEYHENIYSFVTSDDNQTLIEVKRVDTNLNYIQANIKKFNRSVKYRQLFISEQVKLLGLSYNEYFQLKLIPSSLYRINCLLKINHLKQSIESHRSFISLNYIKQQDEMTIDWNKSIKFHKVKDDCVKFDNNNIMNTHVDNDLIDQSSSNDILNEVEEKLNEILIEVCSKSIALNNCSNTTSSSSGISESIYSDENNNDDNDDDIDNDNNNDIELEEVPSFLIKEDPIMNDSNIYDTSNREYPNVYELLQCLTLKSSNDEFDLERYEILGDCFLKLNTSLYIYCQFANTNEGNLTHLKSQRVSNRQLFKLAIGKQLSDYLVADGFRVGANWLPPNSDVIINENSSESSNTVDNFKFFTIQSISDKSLADCIESLLGVYLIKAGTGAARAFLNWLEFTISKEQTQPDFNAPLHLPEPLINDFGCQLEFDGIYKRKFSTFETNIGYKFKNIAYLLQAFTHPSYMSNRYTGSYQRLEFIGDAVLDVLVTQYLFSDEKEHSPGELTDLRQALVNNKFFAHLAAKHGYHKYLQYESKEMFRELNAFIDIQSKYTPENAYFNSYEEFDDEDQSIDDIDAPKFLADSFESVAGAIFLDSSCSLNTVWNVYYKMFSPYFKLFKTSTPKSPIRALMMLKPNAKFTFDNKDIEGDHFVQCTLIIDDVSYTSKSTTKRKARIKVCKKAIHKLIPNENILFF